MPPAGARRVNLGEGGELRVEVGPDQEGVGVRLLSGAAEAFGAELAEGQRVALRPGQQAAFFTFFGAQLEVEGAPEVAYEADETPMVSYANAHAVLEARRREAKARGRPGPRAMAVGPTDVGKSTLLRILTNYAVRRGWAPLSVDLDVGQGSLTAPGCVAAAPAERVNAPWVPPAEAGGEAGEASSAPLAFWYGHTSLGENPELFRRLVSRLGAVLGPGPRGAAGDGAGAGAGGAGGRGGDPSGVFINTGGWTEGQGYGLLKDVVEALGVDVLLVVGQERLFSRLSAELSGAHVEVVKLAKSGGVTERDPARRKADRERRVHEYFSGAGDELSPVAQSVPIDDVQVFRVGGGPKAPASALPIGATSVSDPLRVARVAPSRDLTHSLLAVSCAEGPEDVLSSNVAGFIHVNEVDLAKKVIRYTAPCPGPLPGKILLAGSIKSMAT